MAGDAPVRMTIEALIASGAIIAHKDGNYGSSYPRVEEFGTEGVPFLTAKSLREGYVDIDGAPRLGNNRADELTFGFVQTDDVLLSHNATIGRVAVVPQHKGRLLVGTSLTYFRLNPQKLLPRYLAVYFAGAEFQNQLVAVMSHSTRNQVPVTAQRKLHVVVPPLAEQRAIAGVLGALDDKIELNRRMNATLESMARALFQSWFVDFDPVRAKLDGRQPVGTDDETAGLFPEHLEESPLGNIPAGWKAGTVVDGFNLTMGQSPPGETYNEESKGIPFYQGRTDFGFRYPIRRIYCTMPTRYAKPGDTLVSVRAPVGDINMANEDCCIGRGVAAVRHKSGATAFTYHSIANLYPDFARFEAEGTVFGSINKDSFEKLRFVIPPDDIIVAYERQAGAFDEEIRILENQSRSLATLRDSFLPKLLSGKLSVNSINSKET